MQTKLEQAIEDNLDLPSEFIKELLEAKEEPKELTTPFIPDN